MAPHVAALILAGGQSRRMGGGDKPLRLLCGRSILDHIAGRLASEHRLVAISANGDPSRFDALGLPVLADEAPIGPLAGLLAGLRWASDEGADFLLTVPGDAPFLPAHLARTLAPAPSLAMSAGRRHPTVALWPASIEAALRAHLQALDPGRPGDFSVIRFAGMLGARAVAFELSSGDPFFNINTEDDLARAEARLAC